MHKALRLALLTVLPVSFAVAGGVASASSETSEAPLTTVADDCAVVEATDDPIREYDAPPAMCIDVEAQYFAVVTTNFGEYTIEFDAELAPVTVNNFVFLARAGYFNDTPCHRIIPDFMAQCGDPTGTGTGGPGYRFEDELPESSADYVFGAVAMANAGPNTQGSQFFTITAPNGYPLPPDYTVFGQVIDGFETIEAINAVGNPASNGVPPLEPVTIESIVITGA